MKYQLIIFDFDGTLADTLPWFIKGLAETAGRYGLRPLETDELERLRGLNAREIINHVGIPVWKIPQMTRHLRQVIAGNVNQMRLFPGIDDLLRRLVRHGVTLSIVSSNSGQNVHAILGSETAKLIQVYECGASLFGKSAKFKRVLKQSGFRPSETLCIGDEIRDYEAAQESGLDFGAVSWGYTHRHALEALAPAALFDRPEEICDFVSSRSVCD